MYISRKKIPVVVKSNTHHGFIKHAHLLSHLLVLESFFRVELTLIQSDFCHGCRVSVSVYFGFLSSCFSPRTSFFYFTFCCYVKPRAFGVFLPVQCLPPLLSPNYLQSCYACFCLYLLPIVTLSVHLFSSVAPWVVCSFSKFFHPLLLRFFFLWIMFLYLSARSLL